MNDWSIYQSLLSLLDHQDELLSARTQWLVTSQTLLFIAYFCIDKNKLEANPRLNYHRMLSVLGMVSTIFILAAILAAVRVWVQFRGDTFKFFNEHSGLPDRRLHGFGIGGALLCSVLLPIAFLYAWSLITFPSKLAAILMAASAVLISVFVIGVSHDPSDTIPRLFFQTGLIAGIAGIVSLIAALWLGTRSMRSSSAA